MDFKIGDIVRLENDATFLEVHQAPENEDYVLLTDFIFPRPFLVFKSEVILVCRVNDRHDILGGK